MNLDIYFTCARPISCLYTQGDFIHIYFLSPRHIFLCQTKKWLLNSDLESLAWMVLKPTKAYVWVLPHFLQRFLVFLSDRFWIVAETLVDVQYWAWCGLSTIHSSPFVFNDPDSDIQTFSGISYIYSTINHCFSMIGFVHITLSQPCNSKW